MWHVVCDYCYGFCPSSEFTETVTFWKMVLILSSGDRGQNLLSCQSTSINILDSTYLRLNQQAFGQIILISPFGFQVLRRLRKTQK
jgi:hypothetical protein